MKITHHRKRPLLIASVILLIAIINYLNPRMGYDELLDANTMNVYSNGSLIGTFAEPQDILHTFEGTAVGVAVIDISQLGLKKSDCKELYTIEFVKNSKVISSIEILVPQPKDESTERKVAENCREFNGEYVVMHEDGCYFIFGQRFYDNLSGILAQVA